MTHDPKNIPEAKAQARREVAAVYEHNLKIEIDDALDKAAELKVEAAALAKEVARLTSLIEDKGPHNVRCGIYSSGHKCNCWKGEALEGGK
jgi:hypothetical protein